MSQLFNRDFAVTLNTVRIAARTLFDRVEQAGSAAVAKPTLRAQFRVVKSKDAEANSAEVVLWNLAPDSRAAIQRKNIPCVIEAGYVDSVSQIFSGQLFYANHQRQGPDWVSSFQAADGVRQIRLSRINESFKPGTAVQKVLERAAESLGVGMGNAAQKFKEGNYRGGMTEFTKGVALSGRTTDVMDELMRSTGFEWSIQDGQLQVLREDEATDDDAVLLAPGTGLVGSPEYAENKDKKPFVKARSLLQGTIKPGRLVKLESREANGHFKVIRAVHSGDTWGDDWYTDLEAVAL